MSPASSLRVYRVIVAVLLLVIVALAWKFIVAGSTEKLADGRIAVMFAPGERDFVLREMRGFVVGTQAIVAALARNDLPAAAVAARTMGEARAHDAPVAMLAKLPLGFKSIAYGVHRGFDALAADLERGTAPGTALDQLAAVLQQCVACHATYAIGVTPGT